MPLAVGFKRVFRCFAVLQCSNPIMLTIMLTHQLNQTTNTLCIDAPAGKLEVAPFWQHNNPYHIATDTLAVICHPHPLYQGTMDNKVVTTLARYARDAGFHVLRFNFRGVGNSTGKHGNAIGEIDDVLAVLTWASKQTQVRKLWLAGFSFGGYIAAKVAMNIAENPLNTPWQLKQLTLVAPAVVNFVGRNYDVSHFNLPIDSTLVIYGDNDEIISPTQLAAFCNRYQLHSQVIADCGHFFHGKLGQLKRILTTSSFE